MKDILFKDKDVFSRLKDHLEKDENVVFAYIFGSFVTQKNRKNSDLDVAVYFNVPPEGFTLLKLINLLSNLTGTEVHLIVLNTASPFLKHQVLKYGKPLLIKDNIVHAEFRERLFTEYEEYKYISGMTMYD